MPRAKKPIAFRNTKRRDPKKASAQREAVLERDGFRCVALSVDGLRCWDTNPPRLQCAHLIRRRACGDAIYDPDVAVTLCELDHDILDHRAPIALWDSIVIPSEAIDRAEACVRRYEADRASRGLAVVPLKNREAVK